MDQSEWGLLRETVVRRTQASGASKEDAEDATHDALLAAIGQPQHPQSEVAWLSTVAKRRRVDLIRQRVREERVPTAASDPTAAGPEDLVVERAHASWLAASLTQLPPTTREVVDAVGSGMAPSEVASSMNLSARSVESHLTRARRHLRRMGALGIPIGVLLGWALRSRPGTRVAMVAAVPAMVAVVVLLPWSNPLEHQPDATAPAPATALPAPAELVPTPRSVPGPGLPAAAAGLPEAATDGAQPAPAQPGVAGADSPDGSPAGSADGGA
ncbi:MAG: RNA polymerase sigma factor, partial [Pseudonocardiaceae bacterium]